MPASEAPIPIFTRLNRGRIPLTDAELLKAVLLSAVAKSKPGREDEIAAQWDGIERDLQREEIWAFVAGRIPAGGDRYATRISLLLDTLADTEQPPQKVKRPLHHTFDTLIGGAKADPEKFWRRVVTLHAHILGWFENVGQHNKIGFLVFIGVPFGTVQGWAQGQNKGAFNTLLDTEIKSRLMVKKAALLDGKDAKETVTVLRYGDGGNDRLERLLLLFSVMCSRERFPFKEHVGEVWSLEHIHAQNAQELTRKDQWKSWLELYLGTLRSLAETDENKAYIAEIGDALGNLDSERFGDHFRDLSARIEAHLSPSRRSGEADHTLANLALLSRDDNAALNNAVFEVKPKKLSAIKRDMIARILSDADKAGKSPATVRQIRALASSMFSKAIEWGYLEANPASGVKVSGPVVRRDRFLQADELPRFFAALAEEPNATMRDFILLALLTGARRANLCAMHWNEIKLEAGLWRIPLTKNGEAQSVTLCPEAVTILEVRREAKDGGFVFPGSGESGHIEEPKKAVQRVMERAGIPYGRKETNGVTLHDLRRTLGSWQARTGASLTIIGKSLNHKSRQATAIYARLDLDPVRQSVNTATAAMLEAAGLKDGADVVQLPNRRSAAHA